MAVSYGIFPKTLAIASGAVAIPLAVLILFSSPAGFIFSLLVLYLWGLFLKVLVIAFQPEDIAIFTTGEEPQGAAAAKEPESNTEGASPGRILDENYLQRIHEARIIGGTRQKSNPISEELKEDMEWADMFRSL
jgi:hypothetical protein